MNFKEIIYTYQHKIGMAVFWELPPPRNIIEYDNTNHNERDHNELEDGESNRETLRDKSDP